MLRIKSVIAIVLICVLTISGCASASNENSPEASNSSTSTDKMESSESDLDENSITAEESDSLQPEIDSEANLNNEEAELERRKEAAESYQSLNNPELLRYVEDTVYTDLVADLDSSEYFVENVEAIYINNLGIINRK